MPARMTTHERVKRMFEHRESDRVPITDNPWWTTIKRWHTEGLPRETPFEDYFDLDKFADIWTDNSPRYEEKTIEESDAYRTYTTKWGATMREQKTATSTPEPLDFTVRDRESWQPAKARITPSRDRVDWESLKREYPKWRQEGRWIRCPMWFGFDITHSGVVGTERLLMAMLTDPEWCMDMFNHELETQLTLMEMVWSEGYHFDSIFWWDDMGYKHNQFFSLDMYRAVLKPFHQRAIDWAHAKGVKAHLHSCGDVNPFVPELVGMGLDALNPLEVKAGMNPVQLKADYGKDLVFHGGINAVLWEEPEKLKEEVARVLPVMKKGGGFIFATDHSVPPNVSLKEFGEIVALAKKLGSYS